MCAYSSCACTDQSYAAFQCVASQLCSQTRKDPKSAVCLPCRLLCWMDPSFNRHQTLNTGKGKVWSLEMELGEGTQLKLSAENQDGKPCQKLWTEDRSQTAGQRTRNNRRLHYDFILSEGLRNDRIWAIFAEVCFVSPNHFAIWNQVLCTLHLHFNLKTKGFPISSKTLNGICLNHQKVGLKGIG